MLNKALLMRQNIMQQTIEGMKEQQLMMMMIKEFLVFCLHL